jgi:starch phosphorylase
MSGVEGTPSVRDLSEEETKEVESDHALLLKYVGDYLKNDPPSIMRSIADHFEYTLARTKWTISPYSLYQAAAYSLRDRMIEYWNDTQAWFYTAEAKRAYYLSIEFLMGRSLTNALVNTGLVGPYFEALRQFGANLEDVADLEQDAGLGSGGLGRLAACFLDSLATLNYPAWGYGIRYRYGQFRQEMVNGFQFEIPDVWLEQGNPWEVPRQDVLYTVGFYGTAKYIIASDGRSQSVWEPGVTIGAMAYDVPIPGFGTKNTLTLRLWGSRPIVNLSPQALGGMDPWEQLRQKVADEDLTSVLYPKTDTEAGREMRLKQQYFFCCASLQDIMRRFKKSKLPLEMIPEKVAIQLNDTHPTISIAELMRILLDSEGMGWDEAWQICYKTFSFTNHTVLPEALEKWSLPMFANLLPRHMQIIFEINHRFMEQVRKNLTDDPAVLSYLSIIEESEPKMIRMANLAIVGSHTVNGVARIHSEILKNRLFYHWNRLWPGKITNVTNGVTQRRWLMCCNPYLGAAISKNLGTADWVTDLSLLSRLRERSSPELCRDVCEANKMAKQRLRKYILKETKGTVDVDPTALFDIQVKRIHEYKRQLLNVLGIIARYQHLKSISAEDRQREVPRVHIFAGKAAPSYHQAKTVIKLINSVADRLNNDPETNKCLKVVFLTNYSVSLAELLVPSCDVSEQISTAGFEASGTSCMKFCLNASLLLGTLDGANVEIAEQVGRENMFIFGATAEEVVELHKNPQPKPVDARLFEVLRAIEDGQFGWNESFRSLINPLWNGNDFYCLCHDFPLYMGAQAQVDACWKNPQEWHRRACATMCSMGVFSSDHSIHEYATKIWKIKPTKLPDV